MPLGGASRGVDSLEHGLWLDHELLPQMAEQGTALTPTYTPWAGQMDQIRELRSPAREWFLHGYARLGPLTVAAHAAGIMVLAGTDFRRMALWLPRYVTSPPVACRLRPRWVPRAGRRAFFGLPGLTEGASADFVVYDRDLLADLDILDHPDHVALNGTLCRSR